MAVMAGLRGSAPGRREGGGGQAEIFGKVIERAQDREGRHPAQRAQRTVQHGVTEVAQQGHLGVRGRDRR